MSQQHEESYEYETDERVFAVYSALADVRRYLVRETVGWTARDPGRLAEVLPLLREAVDVVERHLASLRGEERREAGARPSLESA
jgi:hypothetical protein